MNARHSKRCLPCILGWLALPLALLGWWAFYKSPIAVAPLRSNAQALAANGLKDFPFATASFDGPSAVMKITGVAPDEATRGAAFDAAVAASRNANGIPDVIRSYVNGITVAQPVAAVAAPPPPAPADCQNALTQAMTGKSINFETAKVVIKADSFAVLDGIAAELKKCSAYPVEVGGHTDPRGDAAYNKDLSQRRAQAVVDYLTGNGVAAAQLTAHGYGEDKLIDLGTSATALARNRRTEFIVQTPAQ